MVAAGFIAVLIALLFAIFVPVLWGSDESAPHSKARARRLAEARKSARRLTLGV